ncbi:hypothetical protein [Alkalicoccus luteus]|uniref:Uncharacterized protein n=1 Tax=Alkalicoccus luteus TaxID=1237094 RepID=A0A969PU01_9BACI|nr:hypothetical protein [Alkalicoccus luteus]NJP37519.1 hypothetical protein [Alkalicoccus luteus]
MGKKFITGILLLMIAILAVAAVVNMLPGRGASPEEAFYDFSEEEGFQSPDLVYQEWKFDGTAIYAYRENDMPNLAVFTEGLLGWRIEGTRESIPSHTVAVPMQVGDSDLLYGRIPLDTEPAPAAVHIGSDIVQLDDRARETGVWIAERPDRHGLFMDLQVVDTEEDVLIEEEIRLDMF